MGGIFVRERLSESNLREKNEFLIYIIYRKGFGRENLKFGDFFEKVNFWGHLMAEIPLGRFEGPLAQLYK